MGEEKVFDSCLDLMRRLPPQNVEKNLADLIEISPPNLMEDLLATIDQPLKLAVCTETNRQYLLCDYNRDGDSYRSPWSSKYDPPMSDGIQPSQKLRELEIELNNAFSQYRDLYFEGGVSSVYLWNLDDSTGGFAGVVLIKKAGEGSDMTKGSWDSVHVFEATTSKKASPKQTYKFSVTSTIMLWLQTDKNNKSINIGGNLTRQTQENGAVSKDCTVIEHLGRIIEDMENRMRQTMNDIYFGKTKDIIGSLRSTIPLKETQQWGKIAEDLNNKFKK